VIQFMLSSCDCGAQVSQGHEYEGSEPMLDRILGECYAPTLLGRLQSWGS